MALARASAERARAETCGALNDSLQRELEKQKSQLSETEAQLNTVRVSNEEGKQRIASLEKALSVITRERDAALLKIKRANGRWLCEIFHLGCVK